MRKSLFTVIASFLLAANVSAQNVARECVLIEAFTGINCPYCPAAANGIADMLEEGLAVAPLAFHNSSYSPPAYATPETNGRATYYSVPGFPTVIVDGMHRPSVGGGAGSTGYAAIKQYYDQRINVPSPFSIELTFDYHSGAQCQVKAVVKNVGGCEESDVRLFIALTESHIQQYWQGLNELNAVVRDIVTPASGVEITEDEQEITALFSLAGYKKENMQLIAWVQKYSGNREVYQAVKLSVAEGPAQYDLGITAVEEVPTELCSGKIAPRITFRNYGAQAITSVLFNITDGDGNEIDTYQWEGNLANGHEEEILFEEIDFGATAFAKIEAVNLNGSNNDEYTFDNVFISNAGAPYQLSTGYMKIQLKTGDDPQNFSIEVKNMQTGEIVNTFTFEEANKVYQEEVEFSEEGCYRVIFKNSQGHGMNGNGFWGLKDEDNETIIMGSNTVNVFRYEFPVEVSYSTVGVEDFENVANEENVEVYPNPATSVINIAADNMAKVSVYNSIGQLVYTQDVDNDRVELSTSSLNNGLYYINVETKDGYMTSQKVIVNK